MHNQFIVSSVAWAWIGNYLYFRKKYATRLLQNKHNFLFFVYFERKSPLECAVPVWKLNKKLRKLWLKVP